MPDDRLYNLLPAFDRLRDNEVGGPLKALLGVIGDQVAGLEGDIDQLYDDWFIETCQDWLVPYFADLVEVTLGPTAVGTATLNPLDAASRRSEVANAIRDRRAKGTLAAIERFAADTTGWPSRAYSIARHGHPVVSAAKRSTAARVPFARRSRMALATCARRLAASSGVSVAVPAVVGPSATSTRSAK